MFISLKLVWIASELSKNGTPFGCNGMPKNHELCDIQAQPKYQTNHCLIYPWGSPTVVRPWALNYQKNNNYSSKRAKSIRDSNNNNND